MASSSTDAAPFCPWCGQPITRDPKPAAPRGEARSRSTPPCGGVHPDPFERSVLVAFALMPVLLGAIMFMTRGS